MNLSFVIIHCESDTDYIKHLLPTLPSEAEIILIKTIPVNQYDITDENSFKFKIEKNIKYGDFYYLENNFNFSQARNYAKNLATKDWIFSLDADEYLSPRAIKLINQMINEVPENTGGIICSCIDSIPNEDMKPYKVLRLFRNKNEFNWEYAIHEQIGDSIINSGFQLMDSNLLLEHTGYVVNDVLKLQKLKRNFYILARELNNYTDEKKQIYIENFLINTALAINNYKENHNGGY